MIVVVAIAMLLLTVISVISITTNNIITSASGT